VGGDKNKEFRGNASFALGGGENKHIYGYVKGVKQITLYLFLSQA